MADWGAAGFAERVDHAWHRFVGSAEQWLEVIVHRGPDAVAAAYAEVAAGRSAPHQAAIIALDQEP